MKREGGERDHSVCEAHDWRIDTHTLSLSVNGEAKGGGSGMAVWMLLKCV